MPNHATVLFSPSLGEHARPGIGYLVYVRDSVLVAQPFDTGKLEFAGDPGEIYVRSFPDGIGKWQISKGGGVDPRWRRDGREIFYLSGRRVMAVEVTSTPAFLPGPPKTLFEVPFAQAGNYVRNDAYSVSADGKRLLANLPVGPNISAPITVVLNWHTAFRK